MARTRKSIQPLNLYKYDVLIEDKGLRSDYFKISQFDGYFYGGRNAFLVAGTGVLKPNSRILVEILNKDGSTVYSAPITSFVEGNSRLIQVEVYDDTPIGPGKIVILGCASTYIDGTPIPAAWQDKYNIRWTADVIISPLVNNKTPIRFTNQPEIVVKEKFYFAPSSSAFVEKVQVPVDVELFPKYYNVYPNGYLLKIASSSKNQFTKKYLDGYLTGSIKFITDSGSETASIKLPITKIYNNTTAETEGTLIYTSNNNLFLGGFLTSSGNYIADLKPFGKVPTTASININYSKLEAVNTGSTISFAQIKIVNLKTVSGEIYKIRLSYKASTDPGEYVLLGDVNTSVQELLAKDTGSRIAQSGKFDEVIVGDYWYNATMSLQKNDYNISLPEYYYSSSLVSTTQIVQDSTELLNAINATPPIVNGKFINNVSYFIGTRNTNSVELFPNTEYTLAFDAEVTNTSASLELQQSDYSAEVYLIQEPTLNGKLLDNDPRGQLIGVVTPSANFKRQNFETVEFNFTPKINLSGNFSLRFIFYGGFWNIANVSVKAAQEPLFSPDEIDILIPNVNYTDKILTFKAEYLDINNNSVGVSTVSVPTYFTGSAVTSIITSGSGGAGFPYIGNAQITGSLSVLGTISGSIASSSYALTASYAANATATLPSGVVSSSAQINTGSFTGSFKGDGSGLTNLPYVSNTSIDNYTFVGDGITNSYTLAKSYYYTSIFVSVDGLVQTYTTDYSLSGTTLQFVSTPPSESNIFVRALINVVSGSTGSFSGSFIGLATSASYALTASYAGNVTLPANVISSSLQFTSLTAPFTGSFTGSFTGVLTGSLLGTSSWASNAINAISASFATTASYVLPTGLPNGVMSSSAQTVANITNQPIAPSSVTATGVISGSALYVANNATVAGNLNVNGILTAVSQSILYVTSSQFNVATNKIIVNTNQSLQFGGLSVIDSGSLNNSGSLYWDSINNRWLYENASGSAYNSAIVIAGPQNNGALGQERGLLTGRVPVASGDDHIDTAIASSSIRVDFPSRTTHIESSLYVTGSITASGAISGSHIGSLLGTASWASNAISASAATSITFTPLTASFANTASYVLPSGLPIGVVSSSVQVNTGSFTGSFIGTSSFANNSLSSSFAITASYSVNAATGLTGGTTNYIPLWTSTTVQSSSGLYQDPTTGNIGIGTITPGQRVHVQGSVSASVYTSNNGVYLGAASTLGYVGTALTNDFQIRTGGTEKIRIQDATGNVGIGTSNPGALLHVQGNVSASSYTGSFNGPHTGSTFGTASWASNAITASAATSITFIPTTASFATTASTATSITFVPTTASFSATASAATSITFVPTTASFATTASYAVLPTNVISSSLQFTSLTAPFTGSFTGSFGGSLLGTSSWASNAISASYATNVTGGILNYIPIWTSPTTLGVSDFYLNLTGTSYGLGQVPLPSVRLDISGSLLVRHFSGSSDTVYVQTGVGTVSGRMGIISSSNLMHVGTVTASDLQLRTNNTSRLHIQDSTGNVGIATTTPVATLDISGSVSNTKIIYIHNSLQGIRIGSNNGYGTLEAVDGTNGITSYQPLWVGGSTVTFTISNSQKAIIDSSGNMGIGTSTPGALLHVQGNVSASSYTGSFSGPHTGSTFGTASWASNAVSASFSTTASTATSITFVPVTASFTNTASFSSTTPYSGLIGVPVGILSSSTQINSLTGVSASFATTASAATSITFIPATASYALTSAGTINNANTASYVTSNIGNGFPMVVNTNNGSGITIQGTGNSQTAQLRIVANGGAWADNINTAYFQVSSSTGNYVSFMGGTYGADAAFERMQFNSKYTQISNGTYGQSPVPSYVLQVLNLTSSITPVMGILGHPSQTGKYLDVTTSGSVAGNIFTISGNGFVGIGITSPTVLLDISGSTTTGIQYRRNQPDARITLGDPTQSWSWSTGWARGGDFSLIQENIAGNRLYIQSSSGNVGISTSSPGATLHVQGNISASSFTGSFSGSIATATSASFATTANNLTGGTANYIPLWINGTQQSSSILFQTGSNIGVGTTSAPYRLTVVPLIDSGGAATVSIATNSNILTFSSPVSLNHGDVVVATTSNTRFVIANTATSSSFTLAQWSSAAITNDSFTVERPNIVGLNGSNQVRISENSAVGSITIGPPGFGGNTGGFTMVSTGTTGIDSARDIRVIRYADNTNGPFIGVYKARGTFDNPTAVQNGDTLGQFTFNGWAQNTTTGRWGTLTNASIVASANNAPTANGGIPTRLVINVADPTGTLTERMRINTSGSVGIGTTSPQATLHVQGNVSASSFTGSFTGSLSGLADSASFATTSSAATSITFIPLTASFANTATTASIATSITFTPSTASFATTASNLTGGTTNYIPLWTNATAQSSSTIYQSAGNIGIGTTSPQTPLHVQGSVSASTYTSNNGVYLGAASTLGFVGTGTTNDFQIRTGGTEKIRIQDATGNVGIGTSTPGALLHVQGAMSGSSMTLTGVATVQSLVETSTQTRKKNIIPIESMLPTIKQFAPARFNWIDTDVPDVGLIAEQVEQIFPELVNYDSSGNLTGIKYSKLTVLLLKAIQELSDKIDILEKKQYV